MGFGQSFPERRVYICGITFRCFNVHVQTCSSSITSKRCWEDSLNLPMSFPTPTTNPLHPPPPPLRNHDCFMTARSPSKVLLTCISDSYANETKIQPLKEKSTSSKSARWKCWEKWWRLHQWCPVRIVAVSVLSFMWWRVRRQNVTSADLGFLGYPVTLQWCFDNQWTPTLNPSSCVLVETHESHLGWTCCAFHRSRLLTALAEGRRLLCIHAQLDFSFESVKDPSVELWVGAALTWTFPVTCFVIPMKALYILYTL